MKLERTWSFYKNIILDAKNAVCIFERMEMADNNQEYIWMTDAIADHVSLITVKKYLRILGTSDSVYESAMKFADLFKEIFKKEKHIIAHDVFGGLFAEVKGNLEKEVHYLAPDSLVWEKSAIDYREFIEWAMNGNVDEFYQPFLWDGFQEIVAKVSPEEGIMVSPSVWIKECDINAACKKIVPFKDILVAKYQDMLILNKAGESSISATH